MVIIHFVSPPPTGDDLSIEKKPDPSATRIGKTDYWILNSKSKESALISGAAALSVEDAKVQATRKNTLPKGHPLENEPVLEGPFVAGSTPGDLRINDDGSYDCYIKGKWYKYSDINGENVEPVIVPEPKLITPKE